MGDWVFPRDVPGWLTEAEGRRLAALASGGRVLEIGSYRGRSTVCMAQTAARVDAIDPLDGRATPEPGDCAADLAANLERYGVAGRVRVLAGTSEEVTPKLPAGSYDLVFIDGDHHPDAVMRDAAAARRLLAPGGLVAFHDYLSDRDPGVTAAVDQLTAAGDQLVGVVDTLAVVRPGDRAEPPRPRVLVGMPRYSDEASFGAVKAALFATGGACEVAEVVSPATSLLDHCFNQIWVKALDARDKLGVTHFAMIHADVSPPPGWLDTLLAELGDADLISTVVPIKDNRGLTSTALETGDIWTPRRLTVREAFALPETFTAEDVGAPLLLNTGLWVCRLDRAWCDEVCFDSLKRIVRRPDGTRVAQCVPEDWLFSHVLNQKGCKLRATRKVPVAHSGKRLFTNDREWGLWATDQEYQNAAGVPNPPLGGLKREEDQVPAGLRGEGGGWSDLQEGSDGGGERGERPPLHQPGGGGGGGRASSEGRAEAEGGRAEAGEVTPCGTR